MTDRRVEYLPLDSLKGNPRNPKAHDLDTLDKSIGRFGMLDQIVRDDRTGEIVSGHGRHAALTAMQERGERPPEGVQEDEDGRWLVPVVVGWSSRTDTEAAAALIALNRTTELGGWVDDSLLDLLEELSQEEEGLEGVGFTSEEIGALSAMLDETFEQPEALGDDEFDELVSGAASETTLVIKGLTRGDVSAFRALPGDDDAARLRYLMTIESSAGDGE